MRSFLLRLLPALLAGVLLLGLVAVPARGQASPTPEPAGQDETFDPDLSEEMSGTQPEEPASEDPIDPEAGATPEAEEGEVSDETIQQPGWGNAADQTAEAKRAEAETDCSGAAPPTSKMLGLPGSVGGSEGGAFGALVLVIAAAALVVAGLAYAVRRRRDPSSARGSLESVATVVGILGGIAGLAVQFVPGVGAHEKPAVSATMAVRDVNARIPHVEYARKVNSDLPRPEDRREVGNVVWLEIRLEGYRDKDPVLQYGLYDSGAGAGDTLLPGTAVVVPIPHGDEDIETQFVPIWVGYPLSEKFKAAFRLLDGDRVQAIAETDRMKASKYRYSCD